MHKIDSSTATLGNQFTAGDPQLGERPTVVTDDWLNAVQGEIVSTVEAGGVPLSKPDNAQLSKVLRGLVGAAGNRQSVVFGRLNGSGQAEILATLTGLDFQVLGSATPAVFAFGAGADAQGLVDRFGSIATDVTVTMPANVTRYVYAERNPTTGAVTVGLASQVPVYGDVHPASPAAGQHSFLAPRNAMFQWDGTAWVQVQRVFIGVVVSGGSSISSVTTYGLRTRPDILPVNSIISNLYATETSLQGSLNFIAGTGAVVYADSDPAKNGLWRKTGAPGFGNWVLALPTIPGVQVIPLTDAGAGTANALQVTTPFPITPSPNTVIYILLPFRSNTGASTISINGATPKPLQTASAQALIENDLVAGQAQFLIDDGTRLRITNNIRPELASYAAQAIAARDEVLTLKADVQAIVAGFPNIATFTSPPTAAPQTNPVTWLKHTLMDGTILRIPAYAMPTDVIIFCGQSNNLGVGTAALAPSNKAYLYTGGVITYPFVEPAAGANTGSMLGAFANTWTARTGNRVLLVQASVGSSALLAAAASGNNWSPTGAHRAAAVTLANNAIAAINASPDHKLGKVYIVWCQGEAEAALINGTTITGNLYEPALEDVATYFKAQIPLLEQVFVVASGGKNDNTLGAGFAEIRAAQRRACTDSALLRMVYTGASSFSASGLNYQASATTGNDVHWGQVALNMVGACAAIEASKASETAIPTAPAIVGTPQQLTDANTTAVASPSTTSYTVQVGAFGLIVSVGLGRTTSGSGNAISGCSFDGVPMIPATKNTTNALLANAATSTGSPGRVDTMVYHLGNARYRAAKGVDIGGVTGNIVITYTASSNLVQANFISVDSDVIEEQTPCANSVSAINTLSVSPAPGNNVLCVAIANSLADSASALTCTWTGVTELQDSGAAGAGRSGQMSVAAGPLSANVVSTVTALKSANTTQFGLMAACFRKRFEGEEAA